MTLTSWAAAASHWSMAMSELHTAMYGAGAPAQFSGGPPNAGCDAVGRRDHVADRLRR